MSVNLAKNTLYLTLASVGQKVLAFVYFMYLARVLQPEATGAYYLALSVTTIASVITDFGITPVVIREVAKHPDEALTLVRRALGLKVPLMLAGAIGALGIAWGLGYDPLIRQLVMLAVFVMAADSISLLYYGVLRGFHSLQFESLGVFVGQLFTIVFGGAALLWNPSLPLLVAALILGSVFNALFSMKQVVARLGPKAISPMISLSTARSLLWTALPFALAGIFVKVYSYVDSVFIKMYAGTAAVGIYSVAYKLTYSFQFLPMAFVAALYPGLSHLIVSDQTKLRQVFRDATWYTMLLATPIVFGIWAVAPDAVRLAGESYDEAAPVLQTLVFVLIPIFLDFPIGSLLNAANRQGTKTAIMGVTMIINIVLNALFIPVYGVIGAAYAALGSFWFLFLAGWYFVPRIIQGYRYRELLVVVAPILISGLVMAVCAAWLREHIGFVLTVPAAAVVYGAMLIATRSVTLEHLLASKKFFQKHSRYAPPSSPDA